MLCFSVLMVGEGEEDIDAIDWTNSKLCSAQVIYGSR